MRPAWAEAIRRKCDAAGVAFFFKQWGGVHRHRDGRTQNGPTYDAIPVTVGHKDRALARGG